MSEDWTRLTDFLIGLAAHPGANASYNEDRAAYLDTTNLSPAAKDALLNQDNDAVRDIICQELEDEFREELEEAGAGGVDVYVANFKSGDDDAE